MGTSTNNLDGSQKEKNALPTGYDLYLNDWKTGFPVDVVLLTLLYNNITVHMGENLDSNSDYVPHPFTTMTIISSAYVFNGFRRQVKGQYYVTCVAFWENNGFCRFTALFPI